MFLQVSPRIVRMRASQPARIRESPSNILPNELSFLPIVTLIKSRICRIELNCRDAKLKDFVIVYNVMFRSVHIGSLLGYFLRNANAV